MAIDNGQDRNAHTNPMTAVGGKLAGAGLEQMRSASNGRQLLSGTLMTAGGGAAWTMGKMHSYAAPLIQRGAGALAQYAVEHEVISPKAASALAVGLTVVGAMLSMPVVAGALDDVVEAGIESLL